MDQRLACILLAAGQGTRMRSMRAKVLHELGGEPMLARGLRAMAALEPGELIVVVGHQAAEVEAAARKACPARDLRFAMQTEQRGTGDAARCAIAHLPPDFDGDVLIAYGDMPGLQARTLREFLDAHRGSSGARLSFISTKLAEPNAYGRVIRDGSGRVMEIVEAADASSAQLMINEVNVGVYLIDIHLLQAILGQIRPNNLLREYYLTDLIAIARRSNVEIEAWLSDRPGEFAGINSREELVHMAAEIRERTNRNLMDAGVTFIDPKTAYIGDQVEIGADSVIGPNVQILGRSRIGIGVVIEGTAWLREVEVGDRSHIKLGVRAEECRIGPDCEIGPFANLRVGTELAGHNRIGNFVETKKAHIGKGTKASHLSYLGDATIGSDTNVGCGVITVNYDGYDKHQTRIGDRCMIGCDTQLVAPVKVGNDVFVASGTTIVRDASDGALVVSHHPQREKLGWMATWRRRHEADGKAAQAQDD